MSELEASTNGENTESAVVKIEPLPAEPKPRKEPKETPASVEKAFAKAGMKSPKAAKNIVFKKLGKLVFEQGHRNVGRGGISFSIEEIDIMLAKCHEVFDSSQDVKDKIQMGKLIDNLTHQKLKALKDIITSEDRGGSEVPNTGTPAVSFPPNQSFTVVQDGGTTQILVGEPKK